MNRFLIFFRRIGLQKGWVLYLLLVPLVMSPVFGQSKFNSLLSLKIAPGINVPLGTDSSLYKLNYGGRIGFDFNIRRI